jgi:cysteine-rich repeat protein
VCNDPAHLGHCNSPAGGTCDPADRCAPVVDDSAPFANCDAPLATIADVTACLECNANAIASAATGFAYGARRPPFGDPAFGVPDEAADSGKAVLGCQRALGKAASKYFQKVRKATQKCTAGILKAGSGTCPDAKLTDAIGKAQAKLSDAITKKCGSTLFAETLNGDQVLALDPLAAGLALPNSGAAFGGSASTLMNTLATCSDGFAVPSVLGGCSSNCGNGQIDPGEDCDDGNVVNGDNCPADCHLNTACAVTGTVTVTVNVSSLVTPLGALKTYLAYDNTKVNIPGNGAAATASVTASAFSVSANDLDSALIVVVADPADIGSPPYTVQFNVCSGAAVTAADFNCLVEQAGAAAGAQNAFGASCSVTVM